MLASYCPRICLILLLGICYSLPASGQQIIINEIYADPYPKSSIQPENQVFPTASGAEFVELFNTGDLPFSGVDCSLSGKTLPPFTLEPGGYLIICPQSYESDYMPYASVLGLSSWNSLSNSGEEVYLLAADGHVIDAVSYSPDWHDSGKDRGGWSLERINPTLICSNEENWASSVSANGATPGAANSILEATPDLSPPVLLSHEWLVPHSLTLVFSEELDISQLTVNTDPGLSVLPETDGQVLILQVFSTPHYDLSYSFSLSGLMDCEGNIAEDIRFTALLDNTPPLLTTLDIVATDQVRLLFNEALDGTLLLSQASFLYDCGIVSNAIKWDPRYPEQVILQNDRPFIPGESCLLSASQIPDRAGNLAAFSESIIYQPAVDTAFTEEPGIVRVRYHTLPANALSPENYFLSKYDAAPFMVLPEPDFPSEVRLIFSPVPVRDEPYELFISGMVDEESNALITPSADLIWDTRPPTLDSYEWTSPDTVRLSFSEPLDPIVASIARFYQMDDETLPCRIILPDPQTVVLVYCQTLQQETAYRLKIHSLADMYGNVMSRSKYIELLFDNLPPAIQYARGISPATVSVVLNEHIDTSQISLKSVVLPGNWPEPLDIRAFSLSDHDSLLIDFGSDIPRQLSTPGLTGISDQYGNEATDTLHFTLDYSLPEIGYVRLLSDTSLLVSFTHRLEQELLSDAVASLGSTPGVITPLMSQYEIDISVTTSLPEGQPVLLSLSDFGFADREASFSQVIHYRKPATGFTFADAHLLKVYPRENIDLPSEPQYYTLEGAHPDLVWYSADEPLTYLLFKVGIPENTRAVISIDSFSESSGHYWPFSRYEATYDRIPPYVLAARTTTENRVHIEFSEAIDPVSISSPYHYQIDGEWPLSCTPIDDHAVILSLANNLRDGISYEVDIQKVNDRAGNTISDTTLILSYSAPSTLRQGDLVVSEVLPEPSPEGPAEFIELVNITADTLRLQDIYIADRTVKGRIEPFDLKPGEYVVLVAEANVADISGEAKMAAVSPWPTLNNTEDDLFLISNEMDTVAQLNYVSGRLRAGQSLERVDLYSTCGGEKNWLPSPAPAGHTAGMPNAATGIITDDEAPFIMVAFITEEGNCRFWLSEELAGSIRLEQVEIRDQNGEIYSIEKIIKSGDNQYEAIPSARLNNDVSYRITLLGLTDCVGNETERSSYEPVIFPQKPEIGDIILTEILFNPPPNGVDFIECLNTTDSYLDMSGLYFFGHRDKVSIGSDLPVVIGPGEYLAFTPDPGILSGQYPAADAGAFVRNPLPSLPDTEGIAGLMDESDSIWQEFAYDDRYHHHLLRNTEGVSLERIDLQGAPDNRINWASAAADRGYGTPGNVNSHYAGGTKGESEISLSTHVITPDFDGVNDFVQIHFTFKKGQNIANAWIFDMNGRKVITLAEGAAMAAEGTLRWEGQNDAGAPVSSGYYLIVIEWFNALSERGLIKEKIAVSTLD
ncbi:lamin tail domain-containing protein [Roseivirga sp. BDSF3-8]|uniref:lamin tail domain-containing protein n=1 Tax=Roseivirga sp. BDSF3-8 TaxID=3241598 RepID=UPI003532135D